MEQVSGVSYRAVREIPSGKLSIKQRPEQNEGMCKIYVRSLKIHEKMYIIKTFYFKILCTRTNKF